MSSYAINNHCGVVGALLKWPDHFLEAADIFCEDYYQTDVKHCHDQTHVKPETMSNDMTSFAVGNKT